MTALSPIKTELFEKFLMNVGCTERLSYGKNGSHKFYYRKDLKRSITVITSNREVPSGHIKQALKVLNILEQEYLNMVKPTKGKNK